MEINLPISEPRVFRASWTTEMLNDMLSSYGIYKKDKSLRSDYRGKKKTVKQRNKFVTSFFIGKYNKGIIANRKQIAREKKLIHDMGNEIQKEIDEEILNNILFRYKNGLSI